METPKARRSPLLKLFLVILAVGFIGAAGGSVYYMMAANGSGDDAAESAEAAGENAAESTETADAEGAGEDGEASDKEDAEGEDGEKEEDEKDKAVPVSVVNASRGTVSSYVTATANLVAENEVMILAEAEGRALKLLVEEGDYVKKGQLLVALVPDDARIAYEKASVRATNAKTTFERSSRMGDQQMISTEELERSQTDFRVAEQELAEARWRLGKTEIRAPFSGRITARMITTGQHVRPADELFTITDFDPLVARIYLPEKDVIGLEEGRDVRITLKADESIKFRGRIRMISPVVDVATGTVKITVDAVNPPRDVRPGGFVNIDIVRETRPNVVLVPREAVIRELQKAHIFVVKDDGVAERRAISLGLEEDDSMEVTSGIEEGDQVVVAGQGSLKDGSKIKVIPNPEATAREASKKKSRHGRV